MSCCRFSCRLSWSRRFLRGQHSVCTNVTSGRCYDNCERTKRCVAEQFAFPAKIAVGNGFIQMKGPKETNRLQAIAEGAYRVTNARCLQRRRLPHTIRQGTRRIHYLIILPERLAIFGRSYYLDYSAGTTDYSAAGDGYQVTVRTKRRKDTVLHINQLSRK